MLVFFQFWVNIFCRLLSSRLSITHSKWCNIKILWSIDRITYSQFRADLIFPSMFKLRLHATKVASNHIIRKALKDVCHLSPLNNSKYPIYLMNRKIRCEFFFANLCHIFNLYKMKTNSFWQPVAVNLSTSGAHLMDIGQKLHRSGSGADLRGIHQRAQQAAASRSPAASRRSFSLRWVLRSNRLPNIPCPIHYLQWLIFHKLAGNM